jgi:integrase
MTEEVKIAPNLYATVGKRRTTFYTRLGGKRISLGHDEHRAKIKLAALLELPTAEITIRALCDGYLAEQRQMRADGDDTALGENTLIDYDLCLKTVCKVFGDMHPRAFKPTDAAQYLKMRRKQGNGVRANKEMSALSSAFNYGMTSGAVESNPCRGYKRNPERPRQRKVAIAEFNEFLAFAKNKGGSSYLVALIGCCVALTGRRRGEILRLPKAAMTEHGINVKDNKTKAGEAERFYLVEWSPTLRQVITEAMSIKHPRAENRPPLVSGFLFANRDGQPYTDHGFKALWQKLMRAYAPEGTKSIKWFRAHDLRALYVSEMLEQKRDPNTHKNPQTMRTVYDRRKTIKVTPLA